MQIGFVYILLNPAFPRHVKIGRTTREVSKRVGELSRQTGVPDEFIVLYDELVGDVGEVERRLHEKFEGFRVNKNKEFFHVAPREAIRALQEIAKKFPVPPVDNARKYDLLPFLRKQFAESLDPELAAFGLLQLPGVVYFEVTRESKRGKSKLTSHEEVPLSGLRASSYVESDLKYNVKKLEELDAYDWLMIADIFTSDAAEEIGRKWEQARPPATHVDS